MFVIPIFDGVPLHCINEAAAEYHIPSKLIISLLSVEGGKVGKVEHNKNGSYDMGPMQINSSWLPELNKLGITRKDILFNPCLNVRIGAWILGRYIASEDDLLTGIGDYNSHTKRYNQDYYQKVKISFTKIHLLLS
ncbi:MAG: lytic transglycosylase domain-containing protein [Gammaproteobacteria bacterium]